MTEKKNALLALVAKFDPEVPVTLKTHEFIFNYLTKSVRPGTLLGVYLNPLCEFVGTLFEKTDWVVIGDVAILMADRRSREVPRG